MIDMTLNIPKNESTIYTADPSQTYEDILIETIPIAFKAAKEKKIEKTKLNLGIIIDELIDSWAKHGQAEKKKYELFFGCLTAMYYTESDQGHKYCVYRPIDEGYDFIIAEKPSLIKEESRVHRVELTQAVNQEDYTQPIKKEELYQCIVKKLDPQRDYRGCELFVMIKEAILEDADFDWLVKNLLPRKKNNFQLILLWFYVPQDHCYNMLPLNLDETGLWQKGKIYPFELNIKTKNIMSAYKQHFDLYQL